MFEVNDLYCDQDVRAEQAVSHSVPELHPFEQKVYEHDLQVSERGIQIDIEAVENAIAVFREAEQRYGPELIRITNGAVKTANSHAALKRWLHANGCPIPDTQGDTVDEWVSDESLLLEPQAH
jgi:phosphosulfolactate synthase (CoM biosynthesis protein A)